jgi:hypothetical protein
LLQITLETAFAIDAHRPDSSAALATLIRLAPAVADSIIEIEFDSSPAKRWMWFAAL